MAQKRQATNAEIYELVDIRLDRLRREFNTSLKDVNSKIDDVQKDITKLSIAQAISRTQLGAMIAGITIVVSSAVTFILNKSLGRS
jgi:hypothetical protein